VWTGDRSIGRVSAVADVSAREVEERRLLVSLVVAGIVGAIGAAAVGALIGRRAVRPLGEAMALQRRFVADASHELRAPLTVLLTRAQLLSRHLAGQVSVERQAELDRLVTDARNVGEVVTDLLHSVELGQHPDRGVPVGMSALAADVVDSMQPLAAERGVQLTAGPPLAEDAVVGVPVALRRALTALVDNALSHTPSGGHVDVGLARDAEVVSVRVRDDGVGLDPGQAEQLVQRFARGTTREPGRRLGIGLALVDEIAAAHGGTLVLDGEPGRGACVELRLPRRSADGAEPL
jgi:signal transduction histidine kinase